MNREEAKEYVKSQLESYLQRMGIDTRKHFRCLNPAHADEHPSMNYDPKRQIVHCFSCGVNYDTLNLMEIETGLRGKELFEYGKKYFGGIEEKRYDKNGMEDKEVDGIEINKYIKKTQEEYKNSIGEKYMERRGIRRETAEKNGVGYDEKKRMIVLEYQGKNYYISRSIEGKEYRKPVGMKEPLYELGDRESRTMYVVEGQIDALSLIQSGAERVVAIGGSGTIKIKEVKPRVERAVIVMGNDEAGESTGERIRKELEKHKE